MDKIKFVRFYRKHNNNVWEVIYKSGRVKTIINDNLPRTAQHFCIMAENRTEQTDKLNGIETIWSN